MRTIFSLLIFGLSQIGFAQNKEFSKKINSLIEFSVDTISVSDLNENLNSYTVLDSRELSEFTTSHIKNSECVGYDYFDVDNFEKNHPDKTKPIAIYCSIGARSEDIGEKLKAKGYNTVKNVYGGIFEWSNQDLPLVNVKEDTTNNVHTFSKEWSVWLDKGKKVYDQ